MFQLDADQVCFWKRSFPNPVPVVLHSSLQNLYAVGQYDCETLSAHRHPVRSKDSSGEVRPLRRE